MRKTIFQKPKNSEFKQTLSLSLGWFVYIVVKKCWNVYFRYSTLKVYLISFGKKSCLFRTLFLHTGNRICRFKCYSIVYRNRLFPMKLSYFKFLVLLFLYFWIFVSLVFIIECRGFISEKLTQHSQSTHGAWESSSDFHFEGGF